MVFPIMSHMNFDQYLDSLKKSDDILYLQGFRENNNHPVNKIFYDPYVIWLKEKFNYMWGQGIPSYGMNIACLVYFLKEGVHYPKADEGDEGYDNHSIWNIDKSYNIEILKRTYSFMKRHKKHFIYIIEETEGNWYEKEHHSGIHRMCSEAGVSEDRIVYLNNDITLNERYNVWFDKQSEYKTKINMISFPFLLHQFAIDYSKNDIKYKNTQFDDGNLNTYKIVKYKDREKLPTKKFMCLMGRRQWFRENLWKYIDWNEDIKNSSHVSYIDRSIILEKKIESTSKHRILNGESGPQLDIGLDKYYKDSYISIIPETSAGVYVSEKTTKVLYYGHPFIMFNPAMDLTVKKVGMLEKLRDWGFQTFPELFDESYDDLPLFEPEGVFRKRVRYYNDLMGDDIEIRWKAFTKNIERLVDMDIKDLHKLCESVEEKCIHNRKTLMNLKIPTEELLSKLKNIVERLK